MTDRARLAAYVYPGWHPTTERDANFHPGFTEWELVEATRPRFQDHWQPRVPLLGTYDDRDPVAVGQRIALARGHGVDAFVYGFFWCRGKRVFEDALDLGFLGSELGRETPFAVLWANRMPRRILPVRRADLPVIDPAREVPSDVEDFVDLVRTLAVNYFGRSNYLLVEGRAYFAIYDSTFFLRELGLERAKRAISRARRWLAREGYPDLHLAAIEPNAEALGHVEAVGFDSVTHYVFLPDWKGPLEQDYRTYAELRASQWASFAQRSGLRYMPAVAPGWDATPRAADFGSERPGKYPWSPVVTGSHPELFHEAVVRARRYAHRNLGPEDLVLVASLNEWSEGHYLEPDRRFRYGWLEALAD
ncbi:MAG: glycoside hydrolase family 99-like domain-containing protein [Planctomycetota bacterium]